MAYRKAVGIGKPFSQGRLIVLPRSAIADGSRTALSGQHGSHDPLILFALACPQSQFLKDTGLRIEWHEFTKDHTIAGDEELDVLRQCVAKSFTAAEP